MYFTTLVTYVLFLVVGSLAKDGNTTDLSCFSAERNALLKFKASFSDPSDKLSSWNSKNMDCCKWHGIQCDKLTGHVSVVDLRYDWLTSGYLDPSIMELKHLNFLDLSGNDFQFGHIPASIGTLNQLQYLNLSSANFCGAVPQQLGNLSRLSVLDFSNICKYEQPLITDDVTWESRLSSLTHLDMTSVNLTSTKNLIKVLSMLPSIVFLSLQQCGLGYESLQHAHVINSTAILPNIRYLDLSYNSFGGELPYFLENITSLRYLDLSSNSFSGDGTFKLIQNNCNLESLNLGENSFSGDISNLFRLNSSTCLGRKLAKLDLTKNSFYGQLPEEVGEFKKLEYLNLGFNNISGRIPTSISNLSALKTLLLYGNKLNGSIPSGVGNLTSLRELDLIDNQLSGEIPTSLGQLQNLETLYINANYFHGTISEYHLANLSKLQTLFISNGVTKLKLRVRSDWTPPFQLKRLFVDSCEIVGGQFPKWLQNQKELEYLRMSNCSISGAIPDWLRYRNMTKLDLSNNRIHGSLSESLCEMSSLELLDLSRNQLLGYLPDCLANLTDLCFLSLSSNRFSGVIPNSIGGAYSLNWLKLSDNNFTGELPSCLRNCTGLIVLDVGHNKLSGRIPKWIGEYLLYLEDLSLSDNTFHGTIPFELCQLSKLRMMEFANNKLTGNIPRCFGNLSGMVIVSPGDYLIEGFSVQAVMKGVEREYSDMLRYVEIMDLSNNNLVGEIPLELTRLVGLNSLNLSHNHLQGTIPGSIGKMKLLDSLDLSNNNLSGNIPASLSDLDFLGFLNLSHNNLSGEIPTGRHLQTLDNQWNYEGNSGLCGAPLVRKCNDNKAVESPSAVFSHTDEEEDKADRIWFYGVVISGFATGFWTAIGVLVFKRGWRFAYFGFADDIIERIFGR